MKSGYIIERCGIQTKQVDFCQTMAIFTPEIEHAQNFDTFVQTSQVRDELEKQAGLGIGLWFRSYSSDGKENGIEDQSINELCDETNVCPELTREFLALSQKAEKMGDTKALGDEIDPVIAKHVKE